MVAYADEVMHNRKGIDILSLTRVLQEKFGMKYISMTARQWYMVTRDYVEQKTMRYHISDEGLVMWKVAEDHR